MTEMKIGLFGGSFNPLHQGHIYISKMALEKLQLDEVWLLPALFNPLKDQNDYASFASRFEACEELSKKNSKILTKNFAKNANFTFDLVKKILAENKNDHFIWIMGADNLENFHKWYEFEKLINLIEFAIFSRGDFLARANQFEACKIYNEIKSEQKNKNDLPRFSFLNIKNYDISSSEIRNNC